MLTNMEPQTEAQTPLAIAPEQTPAIDVQAQVPAPPDEVPNQNKLTQLEQPLQQTPKAVKTNKLVKPKSASYDMNVAVIATVVIVLGLAILAVYAYMQTKH
jgi:hypothetical protein